MFILDKTKSYFGSEWIYTLGHTRPNLYFELVIENVMNVILGALRVQ